MVYKNICTCYIINLSYLLNEELNRNGLKEYSPYLNPEYADWC